ncbi:MAG: Flp pilus assembly complex ATPase component TadA [Candidatus Omnitrophica bacterium]|nr:Flp pilus assembly complex ATPase component TadA [Candidatus Omnitrophota bacterium]
MSTKNSILIGQLLIEQGIITSEQLQVGLKEREKTGEFICATLIKLGFATEEKVFQLLSHQLNIPYLKLKDKKIDPSVIRKVSAKFASHYKIIPLDFKDNVMTIAMTDPLDVRTVDDLNLILGFDVKGVLASEAEIQDAIRKYYGVGAETLEKMISKDQPIHEIPGHLDKTEDLEVLAEDASIIKFVNQILSEAIKDRATDIHLEPFQDELRTRFRIDGILYNINIPETIKYFHPAIVSRIKIMGHMNIAEHRIPQDGRIKIKIDNQELDLRVSTIPTAFGEAVHIRILSSQFFLELEKIGLLPDNLRIIEQMIKKPHGVIFLNGPTGSGKSTTLYASLAKINSQAVKIITMEDPIEYQLKGINQIQVNSRIGLDFALGLRHMLRHDPDIMMVGEVRDYETAETAIRAALTGHLVFSTLHTNDAAGAVTRLLDMGIEPFLVSSSLECLIAQRLVRLICPNCKFQAKTSEQIIKQIKSSMPDADNITVYEGKGCDQCRFTGYRGRTGIHEILVVDEVIREMIINRASSQQIKQKAVEKGMRTLRDDGLKKVLMGITTYSEIIRVTQQEGLNE